MTIFTLLTLVALIATASFLMGRQLAVIRAEGAYTELHSLPSYHGLFALIWCAVPALLVFALWSTLQPVYLQSVAFAYFPQDVLDGPESGLRMSTVELVANGFEKLDARSQDQIVYGLSELRAEMAKINQPLPGVVPSYVLEAAREVVDQRAGLSFWRVIVVMAVAVGGAAMGLSQISKGLRARNLVEAFVRLLLFAGSAIAILTTIGIVWALVSETLAFFRLVPPSEFFFGLTWNPGFEFGGEAGQSSGEFGILPLLWGTAYISLIALLIAVPVGLMAAVYMSEFASNRVRSIGKPLLEILAGIPTVVYGYFALVTVGPFIRDTVNLIPGMSVSAASVATAGVVMGMMLIPFISSLSDDIINAVPQSLRDGSLGLGATKAETVRLVILPAALPGIVGAVLLAASRAIGETMIVVLAVGATAKISGNPFEPMGTVTVNIVAQLTGDNAFTSPQALVAFALAITLFVVTLVMNVGALRIVRKYREQYE